MKKYFKQLVILLLILTLFSVSTAYAAATDVNMNQPSAMGMIGDAIILRPVGIAATVTGFAFFCVSSPFSALGGNIGEAWQAMVVRPAKFTFARELGDAR